MAHQQPRQPEPQQQQQRIFTNNLANLRSIFSSRWTDVDLMYVLLHANGDFAVAGNTIARHEATGQPPEEEELIRVLRGGGVVGQQFHPANYSIIRRHSHDLIRMRQQPQLDDSGGGERPVTLNRSVSLGTRPRDTTHTTIERGGIEPDASFSSCVDGRSCTPIPPMRIRQGIVPYAVTGQQPEATAVAYPSSMLSSNSFNQKIPTREEVLRQLASYQMPGAVPVKPPKERQPPSTQEMDIINTQACIEASLKENRKPFVETDPDDVALSYAVDASKDTFNEDCQRRELRNSLETRMVQMVLKESLLDPVNKAEEEELFNEAIQRSLSDSVQKSEDELIDEACANSLKDPIRKSEEDLVQEAMWNSLNTMSKDEELVEAVKRQSLDDAYCFAHAIDESLSFDDVAKKPSMESVLEEKQRRSTSTTCKLSLLEDDDVWSESSSFGEKPPPTPPSRSDALLEDPDRFLDSKMPALVSSSDNLIVSSEVPSSEENIQNEELRSLSVEGSSFSIVNGIYEEVMGTNTFTRRVQWEGTIATASIYRTTSTPERKEWVLCLTNYKGSGMDVILFTAAADTMNEDALPSPSTVWFGTNIVQSIVQGSVVSPPKVSENLK